METNWHEWTSCEFYGHNFEASEDNPLLTTCTDCGESYENEV